MDRALPPSPSASRMTIGCDGSPARSGKANLKMYSREAIGTGRTSSCRASRSSISASAPAPAPGDSFKSANAEAPAARPTKRGRRRSSLVLNADAMLAGVSALQNSFKKTFKLKRGVSAYAHSKIAATLLARRVRDGDSSLSQRERVFLFLEEPNAGDASWLVGVLLWASLFGWMGCCTMETVEAVQSEESAKIFIVAKYVFNVIFSIEAVLRLLTYQSHEFDRRSWLLHLLGSGIVWLDVLCCIPFWLRVGLCPETLQPAHYFDRALPLDPVAGGLDLQTTIFDVIRLMEAMASIRLLKLARYYEGAALLARSMAKSSSQLLVPMFMLLTMVVCFSTVLVEVEWDAQVQRCIELWKLEGVTEEFIMDHRGGPTWQCSDVCPSGERVPLSATATEPPTYMQQLCHACSGFPQASPECLNTRWSQRFPNIPTAMWFMMVVFTPSVSLDPNAYPVTWYGHCFVTVAIAIGVLFLAMPLSTIGSNFNKVWEERQLIKVQRLIRQLLMENGISADDCIVAFEQMDQDGNGEISWPEFTDFLLEVLGLQISKKELKHLWRMIDENASGSIDFQEFSDAIFPDYNSTISHPTRSGVMDKRAAESKTASADHSLDLLKINAASGSLHPDLIPAVQERVGPSRRGSRAADKAGAGDGANRRGSRAAEMAQMIAERRGSRAAVDAVDRRGSRAFERRGSRVEEMATRAQLDRERMESIESELGSMRQNLEANQEKLADVAGQMGDIQGLLRSLVRAQSKSQAEGDVGEGSRQPSSLSA
jgi:hypothetical protein